MRLRKTKPIIAKYKGCRATIEYDSEDDVFLGKIIEVEDVIVFQGGSVKELETAFRESVEDYLAACKI